MSYVIGIDGIPLIRWGGYRRYLVELMPGLDGRLTDTIFNVYVDRPVRFQFPSARWRLCVVRRGMSPTSYFWLRYVLPGRLRRDGVDLFWGVRSILPADGARRMLLTVHDLNVLIAPQTMPVATRLAHRMWLRDDVHRTDVLATVSKGTAHRVEEAFGRKADGIVPPGVDVERMRPRSPSEVGEVVRHYGLARYILHVGTLEPRKNIAALIEAVSIVRREGQDLQLVLVGRAGWKRRKILQAIAKAGQWVRVLGNVDDRDLPALYSGASVVAIPSLYEGYGIPAAEARACGARLVVSDMPELRESSGGAAIFVEPTAPAIAAGIRAALASPAPPPAVVATWEESAGRLAGLMLAALRPV